MGLPAEGLMYPPPLFIGCFGSVTFFTERLEVFKLVGTAVCLIDYVIDVGGWHVST